MPSHLQRSACVAMVVAGVSATAASARSQPVTLTIREVLGRAVASSSASAAAREGQAAASEERQSFVAARDPSISVRGSASLSDLSQPLFPGPPVLMVSAAYGTAAVSASLRQPLYDFGRTSAQIDLGTARVQEAASASRQTERDLKREEGSLALAIVRGGQIIDLRRAGIERWRISLTAMAELVRRDVRPPGDLLRLQVEETRAEMKLRNALTERSIDECRLAARLALGDCSTEIRIVDDLDILAPPDRVRSMTAHWDGETPSVARARGAVAEAAAAADAAIGALAPSLYLSADGSLSEQTLLGGFGIPGLTTSVAVSVNASWTGDLGVVHTAAAADRRAQARADDLRQARLDAKLAEVELALQWDHAVSNVESSLRVREESRQVLDEVAARFGAGLRTVIELVDAELGFQESQVTATDMIFEERARRFELALTTDSLLP